MTIFIGSDHGGYELKERIIKYLQSMGYEVINYGCFNKESCDYPDIANEVCNGFMKNDEANKFGILICGTGIGISMAANKYDTNIRCALCNDLYSVKLTREHNNSNFLAMGARIIAPELAEELVQLFITTKFSNMIRHNKRIKKLINKIDIN